MAIEMTCPTCGSHDISKNGTTRRGKQNYKCRDCGHQFVEAPQWQPKSKDPVDHNSLLKQVGLVPSAKRSPLYEFLTILLRFDGDRPFPRDNTERSSRILKETPAIIRNGSPVFSRDIYDEVLLSAYRRPF